MGNLDSELDISFISAGIVSGERIPEAHELRTLLVPFVKSAIQKAGYMTGQEWYDRFEKELSAPKTAIFFNVSHILNAAKKAVGAE